MPARLKQLLSISSDQLKQQRYAGQHMLTRIKVARGPPANLPAVSNAAVQVPNTVILVQPSVLLNKPTKHMPTPLTLCSLQSLDNVPAADAMSEWRVGVHVQAKIQATGPNSTHRIMKFGSMSLSCIA
eukprot:4894959-Pleurochrysis_carterae.AAC.4